MAEKVFGLSARDVPRVKRLLEAFEAGELNRQDITGSDRPFQAQTSLEFGETNAVSTAGTTSATEISIHSSTGDTDEDVDAYPLPLGEVPSGMRVKFWGHLRSGRHYFDVVQPAAIFHALVNESTGVLATDATFAVDAVVAISPVGSVSTGTTLSAVVNILRFPSTNNSEVLIFRKGQTTTYYGIPHPERTNCT